MYTDISEHAIPSFQYTQFNPAKPVRLNFTAKALAYFYRALVASKNYAESFPEPTGNDTQRMQSYMLRQSFDRLLHNALYMHSCIVELMREYAKRTCDEEAAERFHINWYFFEPHDLLYQSYTCMADLFDYFDDLRDHLFQLGHERFPIAYWLAKSIMDLEPAYLTNMSDLWALDPSTIHLGENQDVDKNWITE